MNYIIGSKWICETDMRDAGFTVINTMPLTFKRGDTIVKWARNASALEHVRGDDKFIILWAGTTFWLEAPMAQSRGFRVLDTIPGPGDVLPGV